MTPCRRFGARQHKPLIVALGCAFVGSALLHCGRFGPCLCSHVSSTAPSRPTARQLLRGSEQRRRGRGPSAPVDGAQAPDGPSAPSPSRPAVDGRDEYDASSGSMVLVPDQPVDAPSLAPGAVVSAERRPGPAPLLHPGTPSGRPQAACRLDPRGWTTCPRATA
jgi:hypothetical protein